MRAGYVVGGVVVVCAEVDEDEVGGLVGGEGPGFEGGDGAVCGVGGRGVGDALRPAVGVDCLVPLVGLSSWVAPAACVVETDARVGGDAEFYVAEAGADGVAEAAEGFVRRVHACGEGVADEFYGFGKVGDFDQVGAGGEVDGGDLYAVAPVLGW